MEQVEQSNCNETETETSLNEKTIAFVRENTILYDKTMRAYKLNNNKNKLWEQLAAETGLEAKSLTTRWRSLRDRFVEELKARSAHRSGAERYDRDNSSTSNYTDASQSTDFHDMVEEHLERNPEGSEERDQTPFSTPSTRKRKAEEIDNKMSTLLDKYIADEGRKMV
ncbi:uncharacterized protein LOC129716574 [Wyeomyia smithii]|uniref:uncharacterized protein LOC129716574 n=1 Tax=Wyeomyia smithii TaxID=174621 RepID=UPI002467C185|nr:uncharacterized protein LOC129716574 [Wyeomyia smithii]